MNETVELSDDSPPQMHISALTRRMTEKRRIPPFAEDTLTVLIETASGTGEDLGKDEAKAAITADERFSEADAEEALALLESRGYIYFVEEDIRITPTDD